jgi:drug/metabolite transporter (DMT)-like permease
MTTPPKAASGLVLALGSAACFGFNIAYARLASFVGLSGVTLVFYRVLLMLALVGALGLVLRWSFRVAAAERGALLTLSLASVLVGVAYVSSVAFIPVTVAVVIFYTFPVLIVLASPFAAGGRLDARILSIAALAFAGVVLVVGPAFEDLDPRGLGLAALASVATATQFFAAARCRTTGTAAKVLWIHVVVLPVTALIGLVTGSLSPPADLGLAPLAVILTMLGYVAGFGLQITALARTSAVAAGLAFCLEPVVAALSSVLILGETLSPLQVVGGALVLAAIVANVVTDRRRQAPAPHPDSVPAP